MSNNEAITYKDASKEKFNKHSSNTSGIQENSNRSKKKIICITLSIAIPILIGGMITLIVLLKNSTNNSQENENIINEKKTDEVFQISPEEEKPENKPDKKSLEMQTEYKINTNVNDLRRIYINKKKL